VIVSGFSLYKVRWICLEIRFNAHNFHHF
jgi:hypothetical protein